MHDIPSLGFVKVAAAKDREPLNPRLFFFPAFPETRRRVQGWFVQPLFPG